MNVWKENMLEYLEAGEFLTGLKKKFGGENKEIVKVIELRRLE